MFSDFLGTHEFIEVSDPMIPFLFGRQGAGWQGLGGPSWSDDRDRWGALDVWASAACKEAEEE